MLHSNSKTSERAPHSGEAAAGAFKVVLAMYEADSSLSSMFMYIKHGMTVAIHIFFFYANVSLCMSCISARQHKGNREAA